MKIEGKLPVHDPTPGSSDDSGDSVGVSGMPKLILRLEGLSLFIASAWCYHAQTLPWLWFLILSLVPDVSMMGYMVNEKVGAVIYNVFHTTATYFAILGLGLFMGQATLQIVGLVGLAHVGFDRFAGYGLKYTRGFKFTHLGCLGR